MSIHFRLPEYECKNCKTTFIAYSKGVKCPKCKQPEESEGECYDFVSTQVSTMLYHKEKYGRFFPNGWYIGSYCEQVQSDIFKIFDYLEQNPKIGLDEFLNQEMVDSDGNEFEKEEYIHDLFIAIDNELRSRKRTKKEDDFKESKEKLNIEKQDKLIDRIKKSFISFINKIK